jgi:hypothetical protein
VVGAELVTVSSIDEIMDVVRKGQQRQHVGSSKFNAGMYLIPYYPPPSPLLSALLFALLSAPLSALIFHGSYSPLSLSTFLLSFSLILSIFS